MTTTTSTTSTTITTTSMTSTVSTTMSTTTTPRPSSYVLIGYANTAECPVGHSTVSTKQECGTASQALGLSCANRCSGNTFLGPTGCVYQAERGLVWWNDRQHNNFEHARYNRICWRHVTTTSTMSTMTTTTTTTSTTITTTSMTSTVSTTM